MLKITKRYLLKVPILLLVLCNRKRGPAFLRALLSVFHEDSVRGGDEAKLFHNEDLNQDTNSSNWGRYIYNDRRDRPEEEKVWYDLLVKSDESINDLIHFWRQFCLNWPILTEDLQKLSKVTNLRDMTAGGEGAPLNAFKSEHPILFECLEAVFGTMMSNSRLCEQIHGMMRHGLRSTVGMDQADHQRMYSTGTDYNMKEEMRTAEYGDSNEYRSKNKKASFHSKTKPQLIRLSEQLIERSKGLVGIVESLVGADKAPSIREVNKDGRRKRDSDNLDKQMRDEDGKISRLTRKQLDFNDVARMATQTELTNDKTFTSNTTIIYWREKMEQMKKQQYWKVLHPIDQYMATQQAADDSFIHFREWLHPKDFVPPTSRTAALKPILKYLRIATIMEKRIFDFVTELGGFKDKAVKRTDIWFLFMRPSGASMAEEIIKPVKVAVVGTCKHIDKHYTYTSRVAVDDVSDGDSEEEDDE